MVIDDFYYWKDGNGESEKVESFYQWMKGRNGADEYSQFLTGLAVVLSVLNFFIFKSSALNFIAIAVIIYALYRTFSKQVDKRSRENAKYLRNKNALLKPFKKVKRRVFGEDGYKYFSCKNCKAELRVPKNKGKIKVRCPKCKEEMTTRS